MLSQITFSAIHTSFQSATRRLPRYFFSRETVDEPSPSGGPRQDKSFDIERFRRGLFITNPDIPSQVLEGMQGATLNYALENASTLPKEAIQLLIDFIKGHDSQNAFAAHYVLTRSNFLDEIIPHFEYFFDKAVKRGQDQGFVLCELIRRYPDKTMARLLASYKDSFINLDQSIQEARGSWGYMADFVLDLPSKEKIQHVMECIVEINHERLLPELIKLIHEHKKSDELMDEAIKLVANFGVRYPELVAGPVKEGLKSKSATTRANSAWVLFYMGAYASSAKKDLQRAARLDRNKDVKKHATDALKKINKQFKPQPEDFLRRVDSCKTSHTRYVINRQNY